MLTSKGLAIPINDPRYEHFKTELTVRPETNLKYGQAPPYYTIYIASSKYIYIPRCYLPESEIIECKIKNGLYLSNLQFEGKLKEETNQIIASNTTYDGLINSKYHSGLLSLPAGYGKTTVALHIMCKLKYKTLIVVHKEFLMNQWIERIKQFVPNASVGIIQGSKVDVHGKDVVIGMLQSLCAKPYAKNIFNDFGFTIFDEVHHICTRSFSKILMTYTSKYVLGLSATLERKDGLTKVIHWFLGDILYITERTHQSNVIVKKHMFKCEFFKSTKIPLNCKQNINCPEAINLITQIKERNDMIMTYIRELYVTGRNMLILSDRRSHCFHLHDLCKAEELNTGLYLGGMKIEDLNYSATCRVIIATYSLAHEGLDIPRLDTLIMTTPKSDINQSVGRILRETPGKLHDPMIIDIVDMWGPFTAQYRKRHKYYQDTGFNVIGNEPKQPQSSYQFVDDDNNTI